VTHKKKGGSAATDPQSNRLKRIITPSESPKQPITTWSVPCLHREFEASVRGFKWTHRLLLEKHGIDLSVIPKLPFGKMGFLRAVNKNGRFQPDAKLGFPFFIIASGCTTGGRIEDLVAFHPEKPRQWWLRTGDGYCLGERGSTLLHVDITRFLRDGAHGCVPLAIGYG
jgi:hypothetical protein